MKKKNQFHVCETMLKESANLSDKKIQQSSIIECLEVYKPKNTAIKA
jgi:hypothetical protein